MKGMLVHILRGRSACTKIWIESDADLDSLDLPSGLKGELKQFGLNEYEGLFVSRHQSGVAAGLGNQLVVVAERLIERRSLVVFGAGHVGQNIALIGAILGLKVFLFDDREVFLEQARISHPGIAARAINFNDIGQVVQAKNAAVVIVTRGHQSDEVILRQVVNFDARYVGMIGSRRRVEGVFRRLREQGVSDSFLREVKAPIGLDIGARTPQEIAIAVHAEIIKHFNSADSYVGSGVK
jgi:xanthine/CO dehydrogenase XdhC/CoxF family maturation factor